jgi:excinuclease UvrABC nuclease subunit
MARSDDEAVSKYSLLEAVNSSDENIFCSKGQEDIPEEQVLSAFLKQFYYQSASVPQQVLLPHDIEEAQIISAGSQQTLWSK